MTTAPSLRTELKRGARRGAYDRPTIDAILDEGFVCHVAFATDRGPFVIPTVYGRHGDQLYLHGSSANHMLRSLAGGAEASVCVTLVDGLVLARSAFHTSVNYRSVILYGTAVPVTDVTEKLRALQTIVEHAIPRRWQDVRGPNDREFQRTLVLRLPIDEASAKIRSGPPVDDEEDLGIGCWAGVIPMETTCGAPIADPLLARGVEPPDYVAGYRRPGAKAQATA